MTHVLVITVGILVGITGTLLGQTFLTEAALNIPDGLGDVIGGLAAWAAALGASLGFQRWQTRHRQERDAAIAGEGLVVAVELATIMDNGVRIEDLAGLEREDSEDVRMMMLDAWQKRYMSPELGARYEQAWARVSAFLPESCASAMESLWLVRGAIFTHTERGRNVYRRSGFDSDEAREHSRKAARDYGRISETLTKIRTELGEVALLAQSPRARSKATARREKDIRDRLKAEVDRRKALKSKTRPDSS